MNSEIRRVIKISDKKVADVSQYVRGNCEPRQSNTFQNGKDAVAQCLYVLPLYRKRQELLSQKKPVGRDAVVQTFILLKLFQLNEISH